MGQRRDTAPWTKITRPLGLIGLVAVAFWLGPEVLTRAFSPERHHLQSTLEALPFFPELATYEPRTYEAIQDSVLVAYRRGLTTEQAVAYSRTLATRALMDHVPHASDEAVEALGEAMLNELKQLSAHPDACYRFLYPTAPAVNVVAEPYVYIDRRTRLAELEAAAAILRSANEHPQHPPNPRWGQAMMAEQGRWLYARYGEAVLLLSQRPRRTEERAAVCRMYGSLVGRIMTLPPAQSSGVLRYLMSLHGR